MNHLWCTLSRHHLCSEEGRRREPQLSTPICKAATILSICSKVFVIPYLGYNGRLGFCKVIRSQRGMKFQLSLESYLQIIISIYLSRQLFQNTQNLPNKSKLLSHREKNSTKTTIRISRKKSTRNFNQLRWKLKSNLRKNLKWILKKCLWNILTKLMAENRQRKAIKILNIWYTHQIL